MFLNGGRLEKRLQLISKAQAEALSRGRQLHFAVHAVPLCADTDTQAWAEIDARLARIDPMLKPRREEQVNGATGRWAGGGDPLTHLDANEGYCTRLIGSPAITFEHIQELRSIGVDRLHLELWNAQFIGQVLPRIHEI